MNPDMEKTDFRKQRNMDYDDDDTEINNTKKDPNFRTYIDEDFEDEEPTDKDGNVILYFLFPYHHFLKMWNFFK